MFNSAAKPATRCRCGQVKARMSTVYVCSHCDRPCTHGRGCAQCDELLKGLTA